MKIVVGKLSSIALILLVAAAGHAAAQKLERDWTVAAGGLIEIVNPHGRVEVVAEPEAEKSEPVAAGGETPEPAAEAAKFTPSKMSVTATGDGPIAEAELRAVPAEGRLRLEVAPLKAGQRIDLLVKLPAGMRLKVVTDAGEVRVAGRFESAEVRTETGTIAADVPLDDLRYDFVWTSSRPRFLSDVELARVEEKAAGKFVLNGRIKNGVDEKARRGEGEKGREGEEEKRRRGEEEKRRKGEEEKKNSKESDESETSESSEETSDREKSKDQRPKTKDQKRKPKTENRKPKAARLSFSTARGIVLLNVNPNEVPSNLREKPLTNAAKAVIRSGDGLLTEAIRRASPKHFGEYAATLPPLKLEPRFAERRARPANPGASVKRVLARVTDLNNRAVADLKKDDFQVLESGRDREILSVEPATAPFNLVLLLDVSGSVENYVDFIRKAARAFIETASPSDRIAVVIFNEDVKQISAFTTDKGRLSESLDTFDAGGATAFYDSIAFVLADTLRPMRGERTALVVLTDGDDNHSFLPFDSLLGSIQESGALVYPLYVPSALVAAANADLNASVDPLRTKYMGLSNKAEGEGERLARISGGVYYPITQLSQIQKAYDDIVTQLRTAYTVTFRSDTPEISDQTTASPRLKVRVKRENSFVKLGSVVEIPARVSEVKETK